MTKPTIYYFTYATHSYGFYETLINNSYDVKIENLGYNIKWNNYIDKIKGILNAIKTRKLKKNDIIVYLDGWDTIVNTAPNDILKHFKKYKCDILASKSPVIMWKKISQRIFSTDSDEIASAGMFMGYVLQIEELCKFIIKLGGNDDQRNLNIARERFNIKIDKNCTIFENRTWKNIKNHNVYFVSYPCCLYTNVPFGMRLNRWRRCITDYLPLLFF